MHSVTVKNASERWFSELCPICHGCRALALALARLSCCLKSRTQIVKQYSVNVSRDQPNAQRTFYRSPLDKQLPWYIRCLRLKNHVRRDVRCVHRAALYSLWWRVLKLRIMHQANGWQLNGRYTNNGNSTSSNGRLFGKNTRRDQND